MNNTEYNILFILLTINVATFIIYGIDKWKSKHKKWRISEAMLIGLAIIGGSFGAWAGMIIWRHKTKHKKFKYGIPLIFLLQLSLIMLMSCRTKQDITMIESKGNEIITEHSHTVFLVTYDKNIGKAYLQNAIKEYGCEVVYDYNIINGMALKKPDDKTLEETMQHFKKIKGVLTVEYDHIYHLTDPVKPDLQIQ